MKKQGLTVRIATSRRMQSKESRKSMKNLQQMLRTLLRQQQEDFQTYMEQSFPRTGRTLPGQT